MFAKRVEWGLGYGAVVAEPQGDLPRDRSSGRNGKALRRRQSGDGMSKRREGKRCERGGKAPEAGQARAGA